MEQRKRALPLTSATDPNRRRGSAVLAPNAMSSLVQFTASGLQPTIHLLNYELYVAGFPKDGISSATHSLLQIMLKLFQDSECRR